MSKVQTVTAKFFVTQKIMHHNGNPESDQSGEVRLSPVYGTLAGNNQEESNADWSKWTPNGEIKMTITNPKALDAFELGKSYLVEFTPT